MWHAVWIELTNSQLAEMIIILRYKYMKLYKTVDIYLSLPLGRIWHKVILMWRQGCCQCILQPQPTGQAIYYGCSSCLVERSMYVMSCDQSTIGILWFVFVFSWIFRKLVLILWQWFLLKSLYCACHYSDIVTILYWRICWFWSCCGRISQTM